MDISEASKERGRQVRMALGGTPSPRSAATTPAYDLVPELEEYLLGAVFGEIWGREQLDLKTRSAVTLSALAVLGHEPQLKGHIGYALNLGWSQEEIAEIFLHILPYGGVPATLNALRVAGEVFKQRGA